MAITEDNLLDIITEASYRLLTDIRGAYKSENLENYLNSIGMGDLIPVEVEPLYDSLPDGKIIIFGDSRIREKDIFGCLKDYGISKDRIELHLGYEEVVRYPFNKLQYNPNYRLILFGPVPHSGEGKEDSSSIINNLQQKEGYTKILKLTDGHGLKITKTSLKNVIEEQINNGYLVA